MRTRRFSPPADGPYTAWAVQPDRHADAVTSDAFAHQGDRIGPTAHYTAYVWHRLRLPYAEHFFTRHGALLYWGFFGLGEWTTRVLPAVPSMREYLEYRHRLIDAQVRSLRPDCLVELGAGLTRRAVTWALDHDADAVEIDLPGLAREKQRRLDAMPAELRQRLGRRHRLLTLDVLAPEFSRTLAEVIDGHERPVIVAEGLLSYFDFAPRCAVLAAIARALADTGRGGVFICDLHTAQAQAQVGRATKALRGAIRLLTSRTRALDPFATPEALRDAFIDGGFDDFVEVQPGDHVDTEPRLAALHSPAHIVMARVRC